MSNGVVLDRRYIRSSDVVTREIDGEMLIIPIRSGIGDLEEELYSFTGVGREIWHRLDGSATLSTLVVELEAIYEAEEGEIHRDVIGFVNELYLRRMVVEC